MIKRQNGLRALSPRLAAPSSLVKTAISIGLEIFTLKE
jgi:hypothetical protein